MQLSYLGARLESRIELIGANHTYYTLAVACTPYTWDGFNRASCGRQHNKSFRVRDIVFASCNNGHPGSSSFRQANRVALIQQSSALRIIGLRACGRH